MHKTKKVKLLLLKISPKNPAILLSENYRKTKNSLRKCRSEAIMETPEKCVKSVKS